MHTCPAYVQCALCNWFYTKDYFRSRNPLGKLYDYFEYTRKCNGFFADLWAIWIWMSQDLKETNRYLNNRVLFTSLFLTELSILKASFKKFLANEFIIFDASILPDRVALLLHFLGPFTPFTCIDYTVNKLLNC